MQHVQVSWGDPRLSARRASQLTAAFGDLRSIALTRLLVATQCSSRTRRRKRPWCGGRGRYSFGNRGGGGGRFMGTGHPYPPQRGGYGFHGRGNSGGGETQCDSAQLHSFASLEITVPFHIGKSIVFFLFAIFRAAKEQDRVFYIRCTANAQEDASSFFFFRKRHRGEVGQRAFHSNHSEDQGDR